MFAKEIKSNTYISRGNGEGCSVLVINPSNLKEVNDLDYEKDAQKIADFLYGCMSQKTTEALNDILYSHNRHLVDNLIANVNNKKLSDKQFRDFIKDSLKGR
jgi:hypothetical protein